MRTDIRQRLASQAMQLALEVIVEGRMGYQDAVELVRGLTGLHRAVSVPKEKLHVEWPTDREPLVPSSPERFIHSLTTAHEIAEGRK